jgi:hypothetical protein
MSADMCRKPLGFCVRALGVSARAADRLKLTGGEVLRWPLNKFHTKAKVDLGFRLG